LQFAVFVSDDTGGSMERFKYWLFIVLLLLIILISAGFSLWNTQAVPLSFGIVSLDPKPVSFWVVASFATGGVCGLLLGAGFIRDYKLKKRIRKLEKELANIRLGKVSRADDKESAKES
jgi:uncharacterized integral membrane protein